MSTARRLFAAFVLSMALAAPAAAADPAPRVEPVVSTEEGIPMPSFLELPIEQLPPRLQVIREVLDGSAESQAELEVRYKAATTDADALEIQRAMHELKQRTEILLLNAQLEFARSEGESGKVAELEAILEQIAARGGVQGPAPRPVPADRGQE